MTFNHITPAILPKSYEDLVRHLDRVSGIVKTVQVDVVDGVLAPNKTWPFVQDTNGQFLKILNQEEGLPYWDSIDYEIDLMVSDPVFVSDQWIAAGANRIVIHVKSLEKDALLKLVKNTHDKGVGVSLAVERSSLERFKEYMQYLASEFGEEPIENIVTGIQCMGIDKIGFQHNPFNREVLQMIQEIHTLYPEIEISVDGGVTLDNAGEIYDAGAKRLIAGSAVFESPDAEEALREFEEIYEN